MSAVRFLAAARPDLERIFAYSERMFERPRADIYASEISESCSHALAGFMPTRDEADTRPGLRSHSYGSHRICHRLSSTGDLEVVRILHSRMNHGDHL